jgi:flagellin
MALVVNTNMMSLIAQKNLGKSTDTLTKSVQRLSSGLRINSAADDAAGLAISTQLKADILSVNQAVRNANDAVSLLQTAEGALGEVGNILLRMRELAEQASNGSLGATERGYLNSEYTSLKEEITRISNVTEFAGAKLLDGAISAGVNFQVGFKTGTGNTLTFKMAQTSAAKLGLDTAGGSEISSAAAAQSAMALIDASAITLLSSRRGDIGALQNRLEYTVANLRATSENYSAANSRIEDADFALESASYVKNQIIMQAGLSVLAQANMTPQAALSLLG